MDEAVRDFIEAIDPEHRPLFDRIRGLILDDRPDVAVSISYGIPAYKVGGRRLFVGAWKHGVSLYGWRQGDDGGFTDRHPELRTGKRTIQLRPADAAGISDDEFRELVRPVLGG